MVKLKQCGFFKIYNILFVDKFIRKRPLPMNYEDKYFNIFLELILLTDIYICLQIINRTEFCFTTVALQNSFNHYSS